MVGEQAHAVVGPRVAPSRTPRAVASASGTVGLEGVEGVFEGLGDPTPRPGFVIDAPAADRARSRAGRDAGRRPVRDGPALRGGLAGRLLPPAPRPSPGSRPHPSSPS